MENHLSFHGALSMKDKRLREKVLHRLTERIWDLKSTPKKSVVLLGKKSYKPLPTSMTMNIWVSRCR